MSKNKKEFSRGKDAFEAGKEADGCNAFPYSALRSVQVQPGLEDVLPQRGHEDGISGNRGS